MIFCLRRLDCSGCIWERMDSSRVKRRRVEQLVARLVGHWRDL